MITFPKGPTICHKTDQKTIQLVEKLHKYRQTPIKNKHKNDSADIYWDDKHFWLKVVSVIKHKANNQFQQK
jgi:hypothetical protein